MWANAAVDIIPAFFDNERRSTMTTYGSTLKQLRTIYGYTAKEFSQEIGISAGYLSEIENNKKQPSLELLQKYSNFLDIKLSTLILLTEKDAALKKEGIGKLTIRKMMLKLISHTSTEGDEL